MSVAPHRLHPVILNLIPIIVEDHLWPIEPEEDPWIRNAYGLVHCHQGRILVRDGKVGHPLGPGEVALTAPGMSLEVLPHTRGERLVFDLVLPLRRRNRRGRILIGGRNPQPAWCDLFDLPRPLALPDNLKEDTLALLALVARRYALPGEELLANARLHLWLARLVARFRRPIQPAAEGNLADRLECLFLQDLKRSPTLEDLAGRLGVSRQTLHQRYRAQRGCPPGVGLDRLRLQVACDRLAGGNRRPGKLRSTAEACGFAGVPAFVRWFHRRMGLPPARWRREQAAR